MSDTEIKYRANVAAILRNARGRILVCERLGVPGSWQFPQGGIDPGETPEEALIREIEEEIGVAANLLRILDHKGPYSYLYGGGRVKRGFHGKEQLYFLCEFLGADGDIHVQTEHPEFEDYQWIEPAAFRLEWLPQMKRAVYRAVFADFFAANI